MRGGAGAGSLPRAAWRHGQGAALIPPRGQLKRLGRQRRCKAPPIVVLSQACRLFESHPDAEHVFKQWAASSKYHSSRYRQLITNKGLIEEPSKCHKPSSILLFCDNSPTDIYTLSLHVALPI